MSVPEIVRGEFVYHDAFFVNVGEMKRHPRASIPELTSLLNGNAPKDQVGHFYEAQLLHYGLPRSKDKNTAKVRLLQAINQGSLSVPAHIAGMESEMKKEYAAASRKAKALLKAQQATTTADKAAPKGKKRKQDEVDATTANHTKVTIKVGNMTFELEQQSANVPTSASAAKKPVSKKQKQVEDVTSLAPAATKTGAKVKATPSATKEKAPAKQKAPAKEKAPAKKASDPKAKPEPVMKPEPKVKQESKVKPEPKPKPAPKVKSEPKVKHESEVKNKINDEPSQYYDHRPLVQISGYYDIRAPRIEEQCMLDTSLSLTLLVDTAKGQIWGKFELEFRTGLILITDVNAVAQSDVTTFGWRSRDPYDDSLRFGRGCDGSIEFDGQGLVRGVFYGLMNGDDIEFEGERREDSSIRYSRNQLEGEWNDFPRLAYGRD